MLEGLLVTLIVAGLLIGGGLWLIFAGLHIVGFVVGGILVVIGLVWLVRRLDSPRGPRTGAGTGLP